jgi:hypothetical protein
VPDEPGNFKKYEVVYQNLLPPWGIHFDTFLASNEKDCRDQWKHKRAEKGDSPDSNRIVAITPATTKKQLP